MLSSQRRDKIIELLKEDGSAKVVNLAKIFKVSDVTIRQDLEKLDKEGLIIREHGGAYLKSVEDYVRNFALMNQENLDKKQLIGKKAAEFVKPGDAIILDSGSTTTEIAKQVLNIRNLTVITNSLNIAVILCAESGIELIMIGGEFKPPTLSFTGQKAADFLKDISVDKLFLATAGISLRNGLTYPSLSDIVVKKAMIEAADKVYLVADSSKLGKNSLASLGALSLIDYIITDKSVSEKKEAVQLFKKNDIEFIIAD